MKIFLEGTKGNVRPSPKKGVLEKIKWNVFLEFSIAII
jgi:hypothetical protein